MAALDPAAAQLHPPEPGRQAASHLHLVTLVVEAQEPRLRFLPVIRRLVGPEEAPVAETHPENHSS
jgi:hypothetical protein